MQRINAIFRLRLLSAKKGSLAQRKVVTCRDKMATAECTHMQRKDAIGSRDKTLFAEKEYLPLAHNIKGVIHKLGYNKK